MTNGLPLLTCPSCGRAMISAGGDQPRLNATSFENCVRRCKSCGIGASNALGSQSVTYIHRDPLTNIPEQSREGALEALSAALNIRSRGTKRSRFGFSTSEDAVTWVGFTYLMRSKLFLKALQNVQLAAPDAGHIEPTLLLWGVPVEPTTSGASLRARLSAQSTALGEDKERMSEPDVIVDLGGQGIVFIEVKYLYLSGNDKKSSSYAGWEKYESVRALGWEFTEVKESGCYELARNWCLLKRLGDGRSGSLTNLGPSDLFKGLEGARLDRFVAALGASDGLQFRKVTWARLLDPLLPTAPDWFSNYCRQKSKLLS